jgi:hypothetical protein
VAVAVAVAEGVGVVAVVAVVGVLVVGLVVVGVGLAVVVGPVQLRRARHGYLAHPPPPPLPHPGRRTASCAWTPLEQLASSPVSTPFAARGARCPSCRLVHRALCASVALAAWGQLGRIRRRSCRKGSQQVVPPCQRDPLLPLLPPLLPPLHQRQLDHLLLRLLWSVFACSEEGFSSEGRPFEGAR